MINSVRNTVLSVLNKNNYGYITPTDFNLYAKMAQMEIFEEYFSMYTNWVNRESMRQTFTGHSDMKKQFEEFIERFTIVDEPLVGSLGEFDIPSNCYRFDTVYITLQNGQISEVEKVSKQEMNRLVSNNKLIPIEMFPAYTQASGKIKIQPKVNEASASYVRYPLDPKWTYRSLSGGAPLFDPSQPDYQDFELPENSFTLLVKKILQLSGMSIREVEAVNFAESQEQSELMIKR